MLENKKQTKEEDGGDECEIGDDDSHGEEDRLGGPDEFHHRPPLPAWWPWPFGQSRRFRGLFLIPDLYAFLSTFSF